MFTFAALLLFTQLVNVCRTGDCPPEDCRSERVLPNLKVSVGSSAISGTVLDGSGAPFARKRIQIRDERSKKVLASTITDENGHFALRSVKKGKYRLTVLVTRAFKQPAGLECFSEECELSLKLAASPSDQPYMFCPER